MFAAGPGTGKDDIISVDIGNDEPVYALAFSPGLNNSLVTDYSVSIKMSLSLYGKPARRLSLQH